MNCGGCGADNADGAKFCRECGAAISSVPIACAGCRASLAVGARFCRQCGIPVVPGPHGARNELVREYPGTTLRRRRTAVSLLVLALVGVAYGGYRYLAREEQSGPTSVDSARPAEQAASAENLRPPAGKQTSRPVATVSTPSDTPTPPTVAPAFPSPTPRARQPERRGETQTASPLPPAVEPQQSELRIATTPSDARVFVDGEPRGETPLTLGGVVMGDHKVRVEKEGYSAVEQTVTFDRPIGVDLAWELRPCSGQIVVKSDPPGAAIMIAGVFEGNAPIAKTLKCGRHSLSARMTAHEDLRQPVVVRDGTEEILLSLKLRPGAVRPRPIVPLAASAPMPPPSTTASASATSPVPSAMPVMSSVASSAAPTAAPTLNLKTSGFEVTSGLPAIATLGILTSQYAVELDGKLVVDWGLRSLDISLQVAPGDHRLRILVRNALARLSDPVHDARINVSADRTTTIEVKFLGSTVTVNGTEHPFTFKSWQNYRRPAE